MRPIERIPMFLQKISWFELIRIQWKLAKTDEEAMEMIAPILNFQASGELKKYWLNNPDLRIGQVLVNNDLLPNTPGMWYYMEDRDVLLGQHHPPREVWLWGTRGKGGNQPLRYIAVKDMTTDHLISCLATQPQMNAELRGVMTDEVALRSKSN